MDNTSSEFHLVLGYPQGTLINNDGIVYRPFQIFIQNMQQRGYSTNSIKNYGGHVHRFLNYLHRAFQINDKQITKDIIRDIVYSYTSYLIHAQDAGNIISRQIAVETNKTKKSSYSSLLVIDAAISYFIRLIELDQEASEDQILAPLFNESTKLVSNFEKAGRKNSSMIGGVISASLMPVERVKMGVLTHSKWREGQKLEATRSFDIGLAVKLIESATNNRDKAFYALLAASGCRTHEALQITLSDVDAIKQEVQLYSPASDKRRLEGLTEEEHGYLSWKGRVTYLTFLIEPFKALFFKYLALYLKEERISTVNHRFIFQNLNTGRPFFASDRSSRIKIFKKNAKKAGVDELFGISPHSLRHMYGMYTLNYLPLHNSQYGLPMTTVRILMGHASITSTMVYAKHDTDIIKAQISFANESLFGIRHIDLSQIKRKYHEEEIKKINAEGLRLAA
jgi:integrase